MVEATSVTTKVDRMDVRPGGGWRFIQRDPEGHEFDRPAAHLTMVGEQQQRGGLDMGAKADSRHRGPTRG